MSQPSRPRARGPADRRKRTLKPETVMRLEARELLAPVVSVFPRSATFTAFTTNPPTVTAGTVTIAEDSTAINQSTFPSAAPMTSVSLLTPSSAFGGDIVRIEAGPGGDFGRGVYAISRGAGSNEGAINRPGVVYRVDTATGKPSVFFDLNTVISQLEPGGTAANGTGVSTGLVNWYDIAFDKEGYFDGRPSMFISTVDRTDPNKNAIYRVAPDGTFMGAFVSFTDGQAASRFTSNPTAIWLPPAQQQTFLRGLFAGSGMGASTIAATTFSAFFFDANAYRPGQNISTATRPAGVVDTAFNLGPQVGFTSANTDYISPVYDVFTDFGTPAGGGIPARPGLSGVQGFSGELLINGGVFPLATDVAADVVDRTPAISTPFRRFQDIAFDQYGYFSQGYTLTATANTNTGTGTGTGTGINGGTTIFTLGAIANGGSLFVADLGTGLSVAITAPGAATPTLVPVQGPGTASVDTLGNVVFPGGNLGGRIVRIDPNGVVTNFADNFNTSGDYGSQSFVDSSLSISFSADGTTLFATDNDGLWQFKTVASLAGSTSGSLIGLNDLRTLGVPYDGSNTAIAVLDTGVDGLTPNFRGRVSSGKNLLTNGFGNTDTAATTSGTTTGGGTGGTGGGGGGGAGGTGGTTGGNTATPLGGNGHGTLVAGVVAQFVPETTIVPVNLFAPFIASSGGTTNNGGGTGGGGGGNGGNNGGTTLSANSNALSTPQLVYDAFNYTASRPFVKDPIRPYRNNRVIASVMGFGTTETFDSEGSAYRNYPQIVISLKNQLKRFRKLGIAPIAAAGQLGAPLGAGQATNNGGGAGGGGNNGNTTGGNGGNNNSENPNVGDVNGISLPAILNEVISVTGTIPFPYSTSPSATPNDVVTGIYPNSAGPILLFGNSLNGGTGTGGGTATTDTFGTTGAALGTLTNGNLPFTGGGTGNNNGGTGGGTNTTGIALGGTFYTDRFLAASNRNITTDFAAPALDVPTFRRRFAGDGNIHLVFQEGGTSLSSGIVTGVYATVSSALNYWSSLSKIGSTADAYLTQPVGARVLNYGKRTIKDLTAFNNPDGINTILAWTSVPVTDPNDALTQSTPPNLLAETGYRQYARVDVGNAIAAIEGYEALQYLIRNNTLNIIDTNQDGMLTAQEVQNFVDISSTVGMGEAGSMARMLGGTARSGSFIQSTLAGENPDQPDVLQRRFNFFDYNADGILNGAVSISQLKILAHTLLPLPDAGVVVDRQRASANGFLVDPAAQRNFKDLQHILPTYQFVPKSALAKYHGISPDRFKVNRGVTPSGSNFPVFTLFHAGAGQVSNGSKAATNNGSGTGTPTTTGAGTGGSTGTTETATTTGTGTSTTGTGTTGTSTTGTGTSASSTTNTSSTQPTSTGNSVVDAVIAALGKASPAGTLSNGTDSSGTGTTVTGGTTGSTTPVPAGAVATNLHLAASSQQKTKHALTARQQAAIHQAAKKNAFEKAWDTISKPFKNI